MIVLAFVVIILKTIKTFKEDICNLSRIPCSIHNNPCFLTALEIIKSNGTIGYEDSHLLAYYNSYNPETLFDMYQKVYKLKDYRFDCIFLPWIHNEPVEQHKDTAFIMKSEHDIKKQFEKIKSLISSIKNNGYRPQDFPDRKGGNITGYFIKNKDKKRFYVVSGNHRASVLSALAPNDPLTIVYEKREFAKPRDLFGRPNPASFFQIYDAQESYSWPSVKSGFLTKEEATELTRVYLDA